VAEGARLESVFRGNSNVGSNPTLSASLAPLWSLVQARPSWPLIVLWAALNGCDHGDVGIWELNRDDDPEGLYYRPKHFMPESEGIVF
jgi:hypothetical protein